MVSEIVRSYRRAIADIGAGPVVRIRPDAIHVNNAKFLDQVYGVAGSKRDKSQLHCNSLMVPEAFISTSAHDLHRRRRAPMSGMIFSVAFLSPHSSLA